MNSMLKVLTGMIFALVLATAAPSVSAFPFTAHVNGPSNLALTEGLTATIPIDINNVDFHSHDVTITTTTDSGFIDAHAILHQFQMGPYQLTQVGISISASDDAPHDSYEVIVHVSMDGQQTNVPLTVYVGSNPFLTLNAFTKNACASEYVDELTISIKNITTHDTSVLMHAEQPILFPTFDDENVSLDGGETKLLSMNLNVSPPNTGTFNGTITAENSDILVVRPFTVKVNDCPTPTPRTVSLQLPLHPKDLKKGQDTSIPIKVKNLTDEPQAISVFTNSDIPASTIDATIGPNETATLNLVFSPGFDIHSGSHTVQVIVTASGYTVAQSMTVKVLPVDLLEWQSVTTTYSMNRGETNVVSLILTNRGDSAQTISFSSQHSLPGVDFTFVPTSTTLAPYTSTNVRVTVFVHDDSPLNSVDTAILANGSKSSASFPLSFSIHSANDGSRIQLQFVSAPKYIQMGTDTQKSFTVTVLNPSDEYVSNVHVLLTGVNGAQISVVGPDSLSMAPHESKEFTLTLFTQEDTPVATYTPILVIRNDDAQGTAPFTLDVRSGNGLGLLSGLVTFASEQAALIGTVILLVIVIAWASNRRKNDSPVWMEKSK